MTPIDLYVYCEGNSYLIGSVVPPDVIPNISKTLNAFWDQWHKEVPHPECDSDFCYWLEEKHGWKQNKLNYRHTFTS